MKLEFANGEQIDVKAIFGGPKLIMGVLRDTLRIEVDPETITFDNLKQIFTSTSMVSTLYTYSESLDENNQKTSVKTTLGEGYKIFVSISDEVRRINQVPGKLAPDKTEEVYVVTIAQQTYQEHLLESPVNDSTPG